MRYDKHTGMVIYRSHMHKSLKRKHQLMPGAQRLEFLCRHIPDRFEHLDRYVGWYSNRCRGERARSGAVTAGAFHQKRLFLTSIRPGGCIRRISSICSRLSGPLSAS